MYHLHRYLLVNISVLLKTSQTSPLSAVSLNGIYAKEVYFGLHILVSYSYILGQKSLASYRSWFLVFVPLAHWHLHFPFLISRT